MTDVWLALSERERLLISEALAAYRGAEGANRRAVALAKKLSRKASAAMTVRLEGGFVEEIKGNPIPVILFDYDCETEGARDIDEEGRPCVISEFAPDGFARP